jgi:hypothetical protein
MAKKKEPLPIQQRFESFHKANPHIYVLFKKYAKMAMDNGRTRYSADCILHRIRWFVNVETKWTKGDGRKLNDHYSSRYARLLCDESPKFENFFELRKLRRQ